MPLYGKDTEKEYGQRYFQYHHDPEVQAHEDDDDLWLSSQPHRPVKIKINLPGAISLSVTILEQRHLPQPGPMTLDFQGCPRLSSSHTGP